jgi:hypothetical protein
MKILAIIGACLAILAGAAGTLTWLVFFMSMGANASDAQIARLKLTLWAIGLGGLACFVAGVWLIRADKLWWAAGVGVFPIVALVLLLFGVAFVQAFSRW